MDTVTIIIPVKNASQYIGQCLDSIQNLDYPVAKIDVVIVDNGSEDETIEIVKKYPYELIVNADANISHLRNIGAQKAKGAYLAFVDADCIVSKNWLKTAVGLFKNQDIGAVGSWYQLPPNAKFVEQVWDVHASLRRNTIGPISWVPSGSLIVRKALFDQIGGFNGQLITSEDVDICKRIIESGNILYAHPDLALVHLGNPKNSVEFFLKEKWRGEGGVQNMIRNFPKCDKAMIFAIYELFCLIIAVYALIAGRITVITAALIVSVLPALFLTIKTLIRSNHYKYFLPLIYLFYLYGVSRACSMFSPSLWGKVVRSR